jgi:hypothetical protein
MIAEPPVDEQPRTRQCRRCDVEINAASARCPYCGARQFRRQPILGLPGLFLCLLLVAAAVFATRQVVESHPATASYYYYRSNDLAVLVPAGYQDQRLAAPHGTALAGFASPSHAADTEIVQATAPASGTPASRLVALARQLSNTPGVALGYSGAVLLPGGLTIPSLYYTQAHVDYGVFAFDACSHRIAITLTVSAGSRDQLDDLSRVLPQSVNAICDGADFTTQDRADTAIPLSH